MNIVHIVCTLHTNQVCTFINSSMYSKLLKYCRNNNISKVKKLLKDISESDLVKKDGYGWTPLHHACNFGYTEIVRMILNHPLISIATRSLMLMINEKTNGGYTPLHFARLRGRTEIVKLIKGYIHKVKVQKLTLKTFYSKIHIYKICNSVSNFDFNRIQKFIIILSGLFSNQLEIINILDYLN